MTNFPTSYILGKTKFIFQCVLFSGTSEFESMRKNYTKFVDAYGCLGVLRINAGEWEIFREITWQQFYNNIGLKFFKNDVFVP